MTRREHDLIAAALARAQPASGADPLLCEQWIRCRDHIIDTLAAESDTFDRSHFIDAAAVVTRLEPAFARRIDAERPR
jgi:hypothetical protein